MLNLINTSLFFRRSTVLSDSGSIYLRITVNGERKTFGAVTVLSRLNLPKVLLINESDWDATSRRVKSRNPNAQELNKAIAICLERIEKITMQHEAFDLKLTVQQLKLMVEGGRGNVLPTMPELITKFLEERRAIGTRESTVNTYEFKSRPLLAFLSDESALSRPAEEFTGGMLKRYKTYLIARRDNQPRTADKACQFVKTVLIWAASNEYIRKNPLLYVRVRVDKTPNLTCLTQDEVQRVYESTLPANLRPIADCFAFACYTGLAYQDLRNLTPTNVQRVESKRCLVGNRQKTDTDYCIPVTGTVQALIDKYPDLRLPVPTVQHYNKCLREIMELVGIDKRITSHSARKTFADWCINELGLTEEATIVAMGQKSAKELTPYRRTRPKRLLSEFPAELIANAPVSKEAMTCRMTPVTGTPFFRVA